MTNLWKRLIAWVSGDDLMGRSLREPKPPPPPTPGGKQIARPTPMPQGERELVRMSAEETARWLTNPASEPWLAHVTDTELKRRLARQRQQLLDALYQSIGLFEYALREDSEHSANRLRQLRKESEAGDERSTMLMLSMLGELINQALTEPKK